MAKKSTPKKKSPVKKSPAKKSAAKTPRASAPVMTALNAGHPYVATSAVDLHATLAVLRDREKPMEARFAALQSLGAARFSSPDFASIQGDYVAALREVATDPDPEMRRRALGILAREKDGFALQKLLQGLQKPEEALLPPEKALQLLASDIHAEAYPVARQIVQNPPNPTARREALRLLGGDASSAPTFEAILRDKTETPEIRQISAAALHALEPDKLQDSAREILLDPTEHADMHQTSLTALTQFGKADLAEDKPLIDRVSEMSTNAPDDVKESARQFLGKYNA